ncbi:MAG: hypothetical protein R2848_17905 [Thermomicrobiales bacterium]
MRPLPPVCCVPSRSPARHCLAFGDSVTFRPATGTIALDGERELEIKTSDDVTVTLSADGPITIDLDRAIAAGAAQGRFSH